MKKFSLFILFLSLISPVNTMEEKPYHHNSDGTFRNPEGSPEPDSNIKFSYKIFRAETKKIKINFPPSHIVPRNKVLEDLKKMKVKIILRGLATLLF